MVYLNGLPYVNICSFIVLELAAGYTFYRIYNGSQSKFAYTLVCFTFLNGCVDFLYYWKDKEYKTIRVDGREIVIEKIYFECILQFFYFMISLQSWIFACKYLQSALSSSGSVLDIKKVFIPVAILYVTAISACIITAFITFPQNWINDGSFDQYQRWLEGMSRYL